MKNKWLFIVIFIVISCIIAILTGINNTDGLGSAGINKEEFEEIDLGMSQFEVNGIVDKLDEWNEDDIYEKCCEKISESYKDYIYTFQYKYYGEKSGYAIITYEADYTETTFGVIPEVIKKEKFDLK